MAEFTDGIAVGMAIVRPTGGSPSIKDDTFDDIIANKTEIATLWQDSTFKITLNMWYNEEFRGGAREWSYISNYAIGSPRSSFYVRTHNFFCVLIVYKNGVPQYVVLLNSSYDNTNTPNAIFTYTDTYSYVSNYESGHTYWYQATRADFSATRWVFDPCTDFEFTTDNSGMWNGCMKFKTKGTATYASYRRHVSSWSGDVPVLQDWQRDPDVTVSTYSDLDYTRSNAKMANLILPSYSRFTKLTHDDYQALMNELMYAVNTYLGVNVEMPVIIS